MSKDTHIIPIIFGIKTHQSSKYFCESFSLKLGDDIITYDS